jgi:hypothetical protein
MPGSISPILRRVVECELCRRYSGVTSDSIINTRPVSRTQSVRKKLIAQVSKA